MNKSKLILFFIIAAALIAIDQLIKYIIRIDGGFYICNKNLAFGLTFPYIFLFLFIIILILIITNFKYQITNQCQISKFKKFVICYLKSYSLALIFIISGAISNIIDRLYFGCVIDFIDLKFWPVFNLADIYISAGAIMIMLNILRKK